MKKHLIILFIFALFQISNSWAQITAVFTATPKIGCSVPHSVFFTNASTGPNKFYTWNFGDGGGTSNAQNPVHNYLTGGTFVVQLTVLDSNVGTTDIAYDTVKVGLPNADFSGLPLFGCGPLSVNFADASTSPFSIASWAWTFGDGGIDTVQNPAYIYQTPGVYNVSLTIIDVLGCTNINTKANYVQVIGPDVNFGADQTIICSNTTVNFTDSTIFGAPITSWTWNFGDGSPNSNLQNPSHTYVNTGVYTVSLTVTDIDGCSRTFVRNNYIEINDTIAPNITCPANQIVAVNSSCQTVLVDYTVITVTSDNCDPNPVVTQLPISGTVLVNDTTVWIYSTDVTGNVDSCSFMVTLADSSAPSITCPVNQIVTVNVICQTTLLDYTVMAVTSDNCDANPIVTQFPISGITLSNDTTVWLYSTDVAGNVDSCSFQVTLADTIVPSIVCPVAQIVSGNSNCEFVIIDYTNMAGTADNCDPNPVVTQFPTLGTTLAGNTTVWLYSTDVAGNVDSCSFTVSVIDGTDPIITCIGDTTIGTDIGICTSTAEIGTATAIDSCGSATITNDAPAIFPIGSTTVIWTATDGAGNTATCTQLVKVVDAEAPVISCPLNQVAMLDDNCEFLLPDYTEPYSFINDCRGFLTSVQEPIAGTIFTEKENVQVTIEVQDAAGNIDTCSFMVNIELNPNNPNCGGEFVVTTLFTPNDDRVNDTWKIKGLQEGCTVMVFNRWGQKVFESSSYKNDWEGVSNGSELPDGDYYYIINCDDDNSYKGPLTILRTN